MRVGLRLDHEDRPILEEVRARIARDLHDVTGQDLSAALLTLHRSTEVLKQDPGAARALIAEAMSLCVKSLGEIRTLSYALSPPSREAGLVPALRTYALDFERRSGFRVEVRAPDTLARLPAESEAALFAIAAEAVLNAHRHSRGTGALVTVINNRCSIRLEVRDDGASRPTERFRDGAGIRGMRERARQCGGMLKVDWTGRGTRVQAMVPRDRRVARNGPPIRWRPGLGDTRPLQRLPEPAQQT